MITIHNPPKFKIIEPPREELEAEIAVLKARAEKAEKGRWGNRIFVGAIGLIGLAAAVQAGLGVWLVFHG